MVKVLYSSGMSMALMMSLVFLSNLALQCAINTFGTENYCGPYRCQKNLRVLFPAHLRHGRDHGYLLQQNFGAGKFDRVKEIGIRQALFITWGWTFIIILLSYTAAPF